MNMLERTSDGFDSRRARTSIGRLISDPAQCVRWMRLGRNDRKAPRVPTFEPSRDFTAHAAAGRNVQARGRMIQGVPRADSRHPAPNAFSVAVPSRFSNNLFT